MKNSRVLLSHGAGGVEMEELLQSLIFNRVKEELKRVKDGVGIDFPDDGATIPLGNGRYLVVTMDAYTVNPPLFPGGDIGKLAACGTINDLLMMGAKPIAMLDSIVVEEGFPMDQLNRIVDSFLKVLEDENVAVIGGDFKVMPQKMLDKIVVTTVGLGFASNPIVDNRIREGDKIIVSGYLGDHGATILALQQGIDVEGEGLKSDVSPLTRLVIPLVEKYGKFIHAARDPTRGGLAMLLNDWAKSNDLIIVVDGAKVPVREVVKSYAEMLGIDPLYLACEGAGVFAVDGNVAEEVLEYVKKLGYTNAEIIGEARRSERYSGLVLYRSEIGGLRILEPPTGELVPRIC